ncbi:S-layer homology domain-containing protein [Paenibacillus monticola]|uniref:S-layer homology domain-containing protein n=1 Tax=Paenibacillus monticola TaxID=2666075 RepID=A0A7X2H3T8_9BACL|nr:S-layer homology domain-containing protein [Paenibacillus monticola]MRN53042.1 S-layer homology domain-containing protein [Paenibacillus monticola]
MKKLILNSLVVVSLVCISLVIQVNPAAAAEPIVTFTDIKGHWAKAAIDTAVKNGYFKGYADGTFKPNGSVTRAEFAALLARASKVQPETAQPGNFPDLAGHWSETEVNRAVALGYINVSDYPNGFKPSTPITRMEIAKWMASGLAAADPEYKQALQDTVTTVLPVKEYFKPGIPQSQSPYIAISLGTKLMSGYHDGSFGLTQNATRAETSAILLRLDDVSQQQASSFVGLNELREVGTKRTNMETISPFRTLNDTSVNGVVGKKYTFRNKSGSVVLNNYIVVDTQYVNNIKGIYAPLFVDKSEDSKYHVPGTYRVFGEITIYPQKEGFNLDDYYSGMRNGFSGFFINNNLHEKFGYKTMPRNYPKDFFLKSGVTLWLEFSWLSVDEDSRWLITDDGTELGIGAKSN